MKVALPAPVIAGAIALVVLIVAFLFYRNVTAEPVTPRPDPAIFGGKPAAGAGGGAANAAASTYPGQNGGGAVTPINPNGGAR